VGAVSSERVGVFEIAGNGFVVERSWFADIGLEEHRSSLGVDRDDGGEGAVIDVVLSAVAPGDHPAAGAYPRLPMITSCAAS
jgi:hypothetical protein